MKSNRPHHPASGSTSADVLRALMQTTPLAIVVMDPQGRVMVWNQGAEHIFGWTQAEVIGKPLPIVPADKAEESRALREASLRGETVSNLEIRRQTKTGELIDVSLSNAPLRDATGQIVGVIGVMGDITEHARTEARLRLQGLALDSAANGIVITDRQGVILWVNAAFTKLTGYTYDEAVGQKTSLLKSGHHDTAFYEHLWHQIAAGNIWQGEIINRHKDGHCYPEEQTITPVRNATGEISHFIAIKQDITQRKQFEVVLRESEEQYRSLVEAAQDVIFTLSPDGRITSLNPAFETITGWPRDAWLNEQFAPIVHPNSLPTALAMLERLLRGERPPIFELEILPRDGAKLVAQLSVTPQLRNHQVVGILGVARDATERKRTEQALQESEELFRSLSASSPLGIFLTDAQGRCIYSNPQCRTIFGTSLMESLGEGWMRRVHPDDHDRVRHEWDTSVREGREHSSEFRLRAPTGETAWVHLRTARMLSDNGEPRGHVATVENITERKQAEDALRDTNRQLEQVLAELKNTQAQVVQQERLRALGTMASGIAHDFNNALAAILGFSELLLHRPEVLNDRDKTLRYLKMMNTAAKDAGSVVNRLREFYRHREEGEVFAPLDLNRLIEQAVSLTQPKWQAQAQAAGITVNVHTDLANIPMVAGNAAELREVLTNLIFNAADAMPQGGLITLSTRREADRIILTVTDTGTGMTEEVRQHCFEPFYSTKGTRGTGLGLAMVYGIIQRHQGQIDVQSALGHGTTFTIHLPIATNGATTKEQETTAPSRPLRVLLVDDEEMVRNILADVLRSEGHTVEIAADGKEGLEKFQRGQFDVLVVDRAMPGMSGDQVAAAVKSAKPNLPLILLTGFGTLMNSAGEKPPGVDLVVSKPATIAELRAALASVTSRQ